LSAKRKPARKKTSSATERITIRRVGLGDVYELVYPRSVADRADDMEEVRKMLAAEETDVAEDELRWLVGGCEALLEGHKLLGRIAAGEENWELARVHFGYAYQLGLDAAKKARLRGTLPYARAANRDLHEAGRSLVESLLKLQQRELARHVIDQLLAWDPSDPLDVKTLADA